MLLVGILRFDSACNIQCKKERIFNFYEGISFI